MKSTAELWEMTRTSLKQSVEQRDYQAWIEDLEPLRYDKQAGVLYFSVENDFRQAQLELKYSDKIAQAASDVWGAPVLLNFVLPHERSAHGAKIEHAEKENPGLEGENIFNPRYTFDNFVIGDNSRFAAKAAQAVAEAPGKAYSPLFIYGGSGLGKTHLMNAIGIYVLEHFPRRKVLYVSSETFTEEFVSANLQKKMSEFKSKYRGIDVLLIDDIQFISEKEKTVEEVFNTYNTLYNMGKQMVFTSDRPPKDMLGIDERLQSRLGSGLLVDLQPPSYEIKVAILRKKAALDGIPEDEDLMEVINFIAEIVRTNVRDLESAFNRVVAFAKISGSSFSKGLAKQILKDVVAMSGLGAVSYKDVKKTVASYFGITVTQIDSKERTSSLALPRQIAMYLTREMTALSFPQIAKAFFKDYSTVHHGHDKIKAEIKINAQLASIVEELREKIEEEC
ncbi:MAG: chromosomal replication initiator protein DnaA [Clostridiales Family XIII bacterium]|jgi:chromosomal replication initiator protein|nr:chromosomal replication initiator protein DnaA [Clostridiales Family XIII bacterium]